MYETLALSHLFQHFSYNAIFLKKILSEVLIPTKYGSVLSSKSFCDEKRSCSSVFWNLGELGTVNWCNTFIDYILKNSCFINPAIVIREKSFLTIIVRPFSSRLLFFLNMSHYRSLFWHILDLKITSLPSSWWRGVMSPLHRLFLGKIPVMYPSFIPNPNSEEEVFILRYKAVKFSSQICSGLKSLGIWHADTLFKPKSSRRIL